MPIPTEKATSKIPHVWDDDQQWAMEAAMAANRPLLVRGEPGVGKTQLAYAAAEKLSRPLVAFTVDSATEARDLMWSFDAVGRLAESQVLPNIYPDPQELRKRVAVKNFIQPGPLWWAIDWGSAAGQLNDLKLADKIPPEPDGWKTEHGVVVLIDEIDKADTDVPNGLLEAFGSRQFTPQGWDQPIVMDDDVESPLVIITSNEERMLPDAFVRRCFVLHLQLPDCVGPNGQDLEPDDEDRFTSFLIDRGKAHFDDQVPDPQLANAAQLLLNDRKAAIMNHLSPKPGLAEYLDFLRALKKLADQRKGDRDAVYQEISDKISRYVFDKSSGAGS